MPSLTTTVFIAGHGSHCSAYRFLLAPHQLRRKEGDEWGAAGKQSSLRKVQAALRLLSIPFRLFFAPTEAKPISICASHKTRLLCQLPPRSTDLSQLLSKLCLFGASVDEREQEQRASRQRDQSHQTSSILTLELYRRFKFCVLFAPQKLSNWPSKTKFKLQIAWNKDMCMYSAFISKLDWKTLSYSWVSSFRIFFVGRTASAPFLLKKMVGKVGQNTPRFLFVTPWDGTSSTNPADFDVVLRVGWSNSLGESFLSSSI